jgi:hypothetical protein
VELEVFDFERICATVFREAAAEVRDRVDKFVRNFE